MRGWCITKDHFYDPADPLDLGISSRVGLVKLIKKQLMLKLK